jgi:hypothetical protein|tara:strand:- start:43 stop:258 length:216 start_codon:yes stop_codon:yes gene_type:complete
MKYIFADNLPTPEDVWGPTFAKGKIRIKWSQTRGGLATFVSGRMEGELHDSEEDAIQWLREVGVKESRIIL